MLLACLMICVFMSSSTRQTPWQMMGKLGNIVDNDKASTFLGSWPISYSGNLMSEVATGEKGPHRLTASALDQVDVTSTNDLPLFWARKRSAVGDPHFLWSVQSAAFELQVSVLAMHQQPFILYPGLIVPWHRAPQDLAESYPNNSISANGGGAPTLLALNLE